jgi:hypothetical protein
MVLIAFVDGHSSAREGGIGAAVAIRRTGSADAESRLARLSAGGRPVTSTLAADELVTFSFFEVEQLGKGNGWGSCLRSGDAGLSEPTTAD